MLMIRRLSRRRHPVKRERVVPPPLLQQIQQFWMKIVVSTTMTTFSVVTTRWMDKAPFPPRHCHLCKGVEWMIIALHPQMLIKVALLHHHQHVCLVELPPPQLEPEEEPLPTIQDYIGMVVAESISTDGSYDYIFTDDDDNDHITNDNDDDDAFTAYNCKIALVVLCSNTCALRGTTDSLNRVVISTEPPPFSDLERQNQQQQAATSTSGALDLGNDALLQGSSGGRTGTTTTIPTPPPSPPRKGQIVEIGCTAVDHPNDP